MDVAELSMFLDTLGVGKGDQSTIEFEEAAAAVKSCKNLDDAQKLQLYGLYKQSTVGDVTTDRPPLLDFVGAAKWDAWKSFAGMPPRNASLSYVYIVSTILPTENAGEPSNFGPDGFGEGMGNIVSTLNSADRAQWSDSLAIFQSIESEDLPALEKILSVNCNRIEEIPDAAESILGIKKQDGRSVAQLLDLRDSLGLTPLIFAADRGLTTVVSLLLSSGAEVNAVEDDGNTALILAVVCEHVDIIKLLLLHGADINIQNKSGETALTVDDVSDKIKSLLLGS